MKTIVNTMDGVVANHDKCTAVVYEDNELAVLDGEDIIATYEDGMWASYITISDHYAPAPEEERYTLSRQFWLDLQTVVWPGEEEADLDAFLQAHSRLQRALIEKGGA